MRRWAKVAVGIVTGITALVGLFIGGTYLFVRHEMHGIDSFCDSIGGSETAQAIIRRATAAGLFFTRWQGTDDIWILNKPLEAPPMFRIACAVTFRDGKVSGKGLVDGG
jgi:hypothetical protein